MANAINYAKTYSDALAQAWPYVLHYGALFATPNNGRFRFKGGKSIEIPKISVKGYGDASRDGTAAPARNFENTWETLTLTRQRQWNTLIHPQDVDQTNMALTISNITSVFNNEHKFPEMDAYCVSKIYADWLSKGKTATTDVVTEENILTHFDAMMEKMTENGVPVSGRYLYVTPAVMTALKAAAANRNLTVCAEPGKINRTVTMLDGVSVVEVPSRMLKTRYDFLPNLGFNVGEKAIQIHMFLVHPESVITPVSYEFAQLDEPSAASGGKYVYYEESFEDVFLLESRASGVDFVIGSIT